MTSRPTVSVLMACYNAERFVGAALESVFAQTFADFELIVVDDGSSDRSAQIIESSADDRLKVLRQANKGAAAARNAAFPHSTGDYVLFLDADDLIGPRHLEAMAARVSEAPGSVALSPWDRFRTDPDEAVFPQRPTERDLSGPDWLELDWSGGQPMTQSGMFLLPRALLEQNGLWDERLSLHDDFEFFARMISRSSGVRFTPEARLYYRSAVNGSLSGRSSRMAVESGFLSLDLGTQHLLAVKDADSTRRACANLLQSFEYSHFPHHADLRAQARMRVASLGGADIAPEGPPGFHRLRPLIGWKAARLVQRAANKARRKLTPVSLRKRRAK